MTFSLAFISFSLIIELSLSQSHQNRFDPERGMSRIGVALTTSADGVDDDIQIRLHLGWLGFVEASV